MKIADMSNSGYQDFYNLCQLQRQLKFVELDKLGLEHLDPLRNEIDVRLQKDYGVK